jgi:ABC-type transporter Mla subunit MlaD
VQVNVSFPELAEWLDRVEATVNRIDQRTAKIMAMVKVAQEDLDALDRALDDATSSLADKISALELPAAELQPLLDDVEALRALSAPAPAPTPEPAPEPAPEPEPTPEP